MKRPPLLCELLVEGELQACWRSIACTAREHLPEIARAEVYAPLTLDGKQTRDMVAGLWLDWEGSNSYPVWHGTRFLRRMDNLYRVGMHLYDASMREREIGRYSYRILYRVLEQMEHEGIVLGEAS